MPGLSSPPMPLRSSTLVEQRVDERALRVTGGGMDDHAGRLVDDDEVRILIDDVEVVVFGLRGSG